MSGTTKRGRLATGAAVFIAIAVAAGAAALAQQPGAGPGPGPGWGRGWGMGPGGPGGRGMGPMARGHMGLPLGQLGLTDAQREQIRGIHQSHREETRTVGQQVAAARKALHEAVLANDEARIRGAAAELGKAQGEGAVLRAKVRAQVIQVLTPEQQEKAAQLRATFEERAKLRRERMQQMRQRRPAGPPPGGWY